MKYLYILLIFIPVTIIGKIAGFSDPALFVVPVLTLLSLFFTPMSIVFTPFEIVSVTGAVLIANRVASDGESNWLEGLQLITVYLMIGAAFFFV